MLFLWAILFFLVGIFLGIFAFGGIAIAISFFTKILFFLSLVCFAVSLVLIIVEKITHRSKKVEPRLLD